MPSQIAQLQQLVGKVVHLKIVAEGLKYRTICNHLLQQAGYFFIHNVWNLPPGYIAKARVVAVMLITPHSFKASKVLRHIFIFTTLLSITIASVSPNGVKLSTSPSLGLCVCRSEMYCGKTAD